MILTGIRTAAVGISYRRLTSEPMPSPTLDELFPGPTELAALMRRKDWSATSLGPPDGWPHSLKTIVRVVLTSRFAMWMGWGPDLTFLYNDAYAANDLPKYFAYYADDAGLIFYNKRTSLADYRKEWTESVRTEPIESVKLSDVVIRVSPTGDTAIASYQIDVRTRHPASKSTDEHAFETDVWLKHAGRWQITHVHYSTQPEK